MTIEELQRIVRLLANQCFVRYWMHWNYPATPPLMAIAIYHHGDLGRLEKEMEKKGFKFQEHRDWNMWTIERTEQVSRQLTPEQIQVIDVFEESDRTP